MEFKDYNEEFYNLSKRLEKYVYLNHIFHVKMENSSVKFFEEEEKLSTGSVILVNKKRPKFNFYINKQDSLNFVRYIMLHEQAHVLFSSNTVFPHEFVDSDNSFAISNLTRTISTTDNKKENVYGHYLEEILATYFAYYILLNEGLVNKNFLKDVICADKDYFSYSSFVLLKKVLRAFHTKNGKTKQIDEVIRIHYNKDIVPVNLLLYLACTGNATYFIKDFEQRVEICTWKDFVLNFEKCILSKSKNECIEERKFVENVLQILKEN